MRILAGGNPWTKVIVFFLIIPIAVAAIVFVNARGIISDLPALGIAVVAFFVVYALMTKVTMMA